MPRRVCRIDRLRAARSETALALISDVMSVALRGDALLKVVSKNQIGKPAQGAGHVLRDGAAPAGRTNNDVGGPRIRVLQAVNAADGLRFILLLR